MSPPQISRRNFIRIVTLAGIGTGIAVLNRITQPVGALQFTKWTIRGKYREYLAPEAIVGIAACPTYQEDILGCLRDFWGKVGMPAVTARKILVKPNLVDIVDQNPSVTAPPVVAAVVDLLYELGASQVVVGDGPAFRRDAHAIARATGLSELLAQRDTPFIDLNYDDLKPASVKDGWFPGVEHIWLPKTALEADLIVSVPKMKIHHWSGVSLSLKNLLGLFPGSRYGWPKNFMHFHGITSSILGVYKVLPPVVSVVDGIVGMEGDGPLFGSPVPHGLLVIGKDPVAVDSYSARLMGIEPGSIEHLGMAAWAGVGQSARIKTIGLSLDQARRSYTRPPSL